MAKKLGDFFQIYVAFSEYLNFTKQTGIILCFFVYLTLVGKVVDCKLMLQVWGQKNVAFHQPILHANKFVLPRNLINFKVRRAE